MIPVQRSKSRILEPGLYNYSVYAKSESLCDCVSLGCNTLVSIMYVPPPTFVAIQRHQFPRRCGVHSRFHASLSNISFIVKPTCQNYCKVLDLSSGGVPCGGTAMVPGYSSKLILVLVAAGVASLLIFIC